MNFVTKTDVQYVKPSAEAYNFWRDRPAIHALVAQSVSL